MSRFDHVLRIGVALRQLVLSKAPVPVAAPSDSPVADEEERHYQMIVKLLEQHGYNTNDLYKEYRDLAQYFVQATMYFRAGYIGMGEAELAAAEALYNKSDLFQKLLLEDERQRHFQQMAGEARFLLTSDRFAEWQEQGLYTWFTRHAFQSIAAEKEETEERAREEEEAEAEADAQSRQTTPRVTPMPSPRLDSYLEAAARLRQTSMNGGRQGWQPRPREQPSYWRQVQMNDAGEQPSYWRQVQMNDAGEYPPAIRRSEVVQWLWWGNGLEWMKGRGNELVPYNGGDAAFQTYKNKARDAMNKDKEDFYRHTSVVVLHILEADVARKSRDPATRATEANHNAQAQTNYAKLASLYKRLPPFDTFKLVVKDLNLKSVTREEGGTWEQATLAVADKINKFRKAEAHVPPHESLA